MKNFLILIAALLTGSIVLSGCTQEMKNQPKIRPLRKSEFYKDRRSARPLEEGVIARGHLKDDELLYTGKVKGVDADSYPFAITPEVLARGRERFNIYCSVCHGEAGYGDGMVVQRGFKAPPTFHQDRLRNAREGYLFNVITGGFGNMAGYAYQIPVDDRWAIVAYVKALQLSQNAKLDDVPDEKRPELLESEK